MDSPHPSTSHRSDHRSHPPFTPTPTFTCSPTPRRRNFTASRRPADRGTAVAATPSPTAVPIPLSTFDSSVGPSSRPRTCWAVCARSPFRRRLQARREERECQSRFVFVCGKKQAGREHYSRGLKGEFTMIREQKKNRKTYG